MKTTCGALFFLFLVHVAEAAPPQAALSIRVTDDWGKAVVAVPVRISTYSGTRGGEGFGEDIYKNVVLRTDMDGFVTWKGPSRMPYVPFGVLPVEGYYSSDGSEYRFKEVKDDKWQPWNPTIELILKPIINPIPMYVSHIEAFIQTTNRRFGFDLVAEDWVEPQGKGKVADMFFEVIGFWKTNREYDSTLIVSFPGPLDGILAIETPPPGKRSELWSPREAPLEGYSQELRLRKARTAKRTLQDDVSAERSYLLRIRSVADEQGKLKSALYGKIHQGLTFGGAVEHCYLRIGTVYLNPELNSRNMEFDPKKKLSKPAKK